jgi:hypothetical protein
MSEAIIIALLSVNTVAILFFIYSYGIAKNWWSN